MFKENISMNKVINHTTWQVKINEEIDLPEDKQPLFNVIREKGRCVVENVRVRDEQVVVQGTFYYDLLYSTKEQEFMNGYQGEVGFEESFKVSGIKEDVIMKTQANVEHITVKKVNNGKVLIKGDISLFTTMWENTYTQAVSMMEEGKSISLKQKQLEILNLVTEKNETFRVKEELVIPSSKPEVSSVIWSDFKIKNFSTKVLEGMVHVSGEISLFLIYLSEESTIGQQWHEVTVPFSGNIDVMQVKEECIAYLNAEIAHCSVECKANDLFEKRNLEVDVLLDLQFKFYEEETINVVEDVYSTEKELVPMVENAEYKCLLIKNSTREKKVARISTDKNKGSLLQICNASADVKVNNISVIEDGLQVQGKLVMHILYVTANDDEPVIHIHKEEEFTSVIEADGISKEDEYYVNWRAEQVGATMQSMDEIEMQATLVFEAIVLKNCCQQVITDIEEREIDYERVSKLPTVKGYVVQEGDKLWDIAKKNHTTVEKIKMYNNLKTEQINKGDRLLIVKGVSVAKD